MRKRIKIIQIPAISTITQMETAANNALSNGWEFVQVFILGANTYAIFQKTVVS